MLITALMLGAAQLPEGLAPASCDVGVATAEQREALKDFDFLIGDYSVTGHVWQGEQWSPPRPNVPPARWNGRYGLGGKAIIDEWFDNDPGLDPDSKRGVNARMKKADGSWYMSWVSDHREGVQHLVASLTNDGVLEMTQLYPARPGFRAQFIRLDENNWVRIHYHRDAQGKKLPPIMLKATRIPCSS